MRAYLVSLGQPWIDDPSNSDRRFERVRVRETLAEEGRPDLQRLELADIAEKAGRAARAMAGVTEQWLNGQLTSYPEGFGAIPRAGFYELDPGLQRRVLQHLLLIFGAGNRAEPGELDYLAKWIMGQGISRRTLGGAMLACRQSSVLIGREWARISPDPVIVPDSGGNPLGRAIFDPCAAPSAGCCRGAPTWRGAAGGHSELCAAKPACGAHG